MARIRTVKPDFFRHERLYDAERKAKLPLRLAFAGLWTAADREGRFRWSPRTLKLDCLPYDDGVDFEAVLDALALGDFIRKYQADGEFYGFIPSWSDHQVINQREAQSKLPEPSDASICVHSTEQVPAHGEGKGRGRERKGRSISDADASSVSDFEEFWKAYPRREGANPKEPARKLFLAAVKAGADPKGIIAGARGCREAETKNVGTPYIPQAVKWLRDQRWGDYAAGGSNGIVDDGCIEVLDQLALEAWDAYGRQTTGKPFPRNKKGGWRFPTRWPPGSAQQMVEGVQRLISQRAAE